MSDYNETPVYTQEEVELLMSLTRLTSLRERWSVRVQELKRDLANAESIALGYAEDVEETNKRLAAI